MDIPDELLDEIIAKMSAAIDRIHVGTNPEWCDRAAISAFDAAYPLVAARVRADTANRIADAIIACDNDGAEKKPGRRAGLRDAYDIARGFGGAP